MASVAYSRTKRHINISPYNTKGILVGLVCSETSSSILSDMDRLAKDMKCQTSH